MCCSLLSLVFVFLLHLADMVEVVNAEVVSTRSCGIEPLLQRGLHPLLYKADLFFWECQPRTHFHAGSLFDVGNLIVFLVFTSQKRKPLGKR